MTADDWTKKLRGYAGFFDWPDKSAKEYGIAYEFIKALEREGGPRITSAQRHGSGDDPPDCTLITGTGQRWGLEITELVSQKAIEVTKRGGAAYATWPDSALIDRVGALIARKDIPAAKVKGGPYDRYVLLIHTDEFFLSAGRLQALLGNQIFKTSLIDHVYVLVSYDPHVQHQPLLSFTTTKGS
jgi:hypothetical protein